MKKLIEIKHLDVGMFLEAEVIREEKEGEEQRFLVPRNAIQAGQSTKRARLTGSMHERVERDGGLMLSSSAFIDRFRELGYTTVSIDTDKGKDLPESVKPLTDPNRPPPPPGRLVHFDEEIERATEARDQTAETLKTALEDVASGRGVDATALAGASEVITESILRNMDAMVSLTRIKAHDAYTAIHCMNVCTLVVAMANGQGLNRSILNMITTAALLHDVGKTRVPLEILNKPGRFEPHELQEMRKHATYSGDIMREEGGFPDEAIAIATQHHEMMNGSGYPLGLKGDEIHPYARMTAVADVYDALTAKRVYKPGMPMYQALLRIIKNRGTEFDDQVVEGFIKVLGLYPVGSLVEMNTKEQSIVVEPNPLDSRKPKVALLTMPNQKPRPVPLVVSLTKRSEAEGREILKVLDPETLDVDVEELMKEVKERGETTERRRR